ncbi:MAG TPA: hypothetical protein VMI31_09405 [Fimbriimonadaceae bacterium]|nr:hypothetical protein [Fimbriimonadaceae bacterium]
MARKKRYGGLKRKSGYAKKGLMPACLANEEPAMTLSCEKVADVAIDIWRLGERAKVERPSDKIIAAWERAEDRIRRLGFRLDNMQDRPYDENLRVRVVEHEPGEGVKIISECLTPAVFFNGILIREAEVVTRGKE